MTLTPKGYCDIDGKNDGDESDDEAEMTLTPKGCCDEPFQEESLGLPFIYEN